MATSLRKLLDEVLDPLFRWESNLDATRLAAFTRPDSTNRVAFDAHYGRIRADPTVLLLAIEEDTDFAGMIASFTADDKREISYWIDPERWGQGIAKRSLLAFLKVETTRPLFARVAEHNLGSISVLKQSGFTKCGSEKSFAGGVGTEITEFIFMLDE